MKKIHSIYRWQGKIHYSKEVELSILAPTVNKEDIINVINTLSSYELPEIVIRRIEMMDTVINWCNNELK